eukprot:CAMPEP_0181345724 /NCGR_PEP_ID=MMETSP1101-20121128/32918_1 /TAXON_ID=46948 /ORGANISM="Rhodomonas abbreviata, Strain Caron Lab Isolate" /LENGTH=186 /DNA_ID=CAMNT_0023457731 /DNA_START=59 /DNA_END=616 /DNA_ORIENTATION=+
MASRTLRGTKFPQLALNAVNCVSVPNAASRSRLLHIPVQSMALKQNRPCALSSNSVVPLLGRNALFPASISGCRWFAKGKAREVKEVAKKTKKKTGKHSTVASTKLYQKLDKEAKMDSVDVEEMVQEPPPGWNIVDLQPHLGAGEFGLTMLQKQNPTELVSVLSTFQFVADEDDVEDVDEDDTQAP